MSGLAPANSESAIVPTSNVLISPGAAQAPNLVQKATQQLHQTGGLVNARMSMVIGNGDAASTEEVSKRIEGGTQITQNFLDSLGDEKKVIGALKDRRDALLASAVSASAVSRLVLKNPLFRQGSEGVCDLALELKDEAEATAAKNECPIRIKTAESTPEKSRRAATEDAEGSVEAGK